MDANTLWKRYTTYYCAVPELGFSLDISRMNFPDDFWQTIEAPMAKAFDAMEQLEQGAIANPDEKRMVGHYWLRAPELAPDKNLRIEIESTINKIKKFADDVHQSRVTAPDGQPFKNILMVGIGGSALGPQLVADALGCSDDPMTPFFCDNTDPDGIDRTLAQIGADLPKTLVVVTSKSGGTKETRNGMLEVANAYQQAGLSFPKYAVAITGKGSALDQLASKENWLEIFPMWDWVGGRTSELSAVGLLPACLQGLDIDGLLAGAARMDIETRKKDIGSNPAALLAAMWFYAGKGHGERDMIILPYKDRLLLLSKYLQQLIMESLGKELDLDGNVVHQGIAVYGNKGSTDQHAYVQQLRDGVNNFFVTLIQVLHDRNKTSIEVEPDVTSGDYLQGFLLGTRQALYENGRESMTIGLEELDASRLGALIALFERAVGFYATLINVNAYHQPGVEAGKKAAGIVLELQTKILAFLRSQPGIRKTAEEIAQGIGEPESIESVYLILSHLVANPDRGVTSGNEAEPGARSFGVA